MVLPSKLLLGSRSTSHTCVERTIYRRVLLSSRTLPEILAGHMGARRNEPIVILVSGRGHWFRVVRGALAGVRCGLQSSAFFLSEIASLKPAEHKGQAAVLSLPSQCPGSRCWRSSERGNLTLLRTGSWPMQRCFCTN